MKLVAYCRKSTDEKHKQVLSIESQVTELKQFARRENLKVVDWITESKTAKVPGRVGFARLLQLIEVGKADGILSWHPDRLARNSIDGGRIIYLLDTNKLKFLKFPSFWFENTPQGKFMLNIAFGQSKYYVDNLSENVSRGLRQKIRNGVWPSKAPHGYFNCPQTRMIKVDRRKSKVVKQAFELFVSGNKTYQEIGEFLSRHGVKAVNKVLHQSQVKNLLTNPFYIGVMSYAGEKYKGIHKQFISKKLFDQVQEQVKFKSKPRYKGHNFVFTGLIKCRECGGAITAEQQIKHFPKTRGEVRYVYYHCTKKRGKCSQPYLPENKLISQLKTLITDIALPISWAKDWRRWANEEHQKELQNYGLKTKETKSKIKTISQKLDRLLDLYLEQNLDEKVYKVKQNQLFDQKLKLETQLKKTKDNGSSWLEPLTEFIDCALRAHKIARKENTNAKIKDFAKRVGSNYFLDQKEIIVHYKKPFASFRAATLARATNPGVAWKSISVELTGFEPVTSAM